MAVEVIGREVHLGPRRQPHRLHLLVGDAKDQDVVQPFTGRGVDRVLALCAVETEEFVVDEERRTIVVADLFDRLGHRQCHRFTSRMVTMADHSLSRAAVVNRTLER